MLVVVFLFALFCWLGFRIARTAADPFGQYLAVGLTATIGLTAFMHMAVSLGLMPTTGLTLPFMSYGRSSQVISLLGTGILINIGRLRGKPRAAMARRTGEDAERMTRDEAGREARERASSRVPPCAPPSSSPAAAPAAISCPRSRSRRRSRERAPDVEPVLVGAVRGVEARLLPTRDFRYHLLPSEPIYRRTWWKNVRWPLIAGHLLRRGRPAVSPRSGPSPCSAPGGYASAPVVWWAARHGIPTAIQEQNAYPGLATRLLSRRVRHVYLGLPEARSLLRFGAATEVFDTGNPIAPPTPERRAAALARFGLDGTRPGGARDRRQPGRARASTGPSPAGSMRAARRASICSGSPGRGTHDGVRPHHRPPAVQVIDFLDPMADGYAVADLVVSPGGHDHRGRALRVGTAEHPGAAADRRGRPPDPQRPRARRGRRVARCCRRRSSPRPGSATAWADLLGDRTRREAMAARALARGRPHAAADIVSNLLTLIA